MVPVITNKLLNSYLVMVVGCVAAATTVTAAADSSARCRESIGSLHGAARLLKGEGTYRLRCWVMNMVEEVVSIAVAVTMDVLRAAGLLRRRRLQAAWMGVAQGQVTRWGASTRGVLLTAGWESGHGCACVFTCCTWQTWSAVIWWEQDMWLRKIEAEKAG